jgi:hypothetical protein
VESHFSNFTPEAMRALGQAFAAGAQKRMEFVEQIRSATFTLLADSRQQLEEAEADRRQRAAGEADSRRLFVSELRSEVHALRNRFELARRDMAADLQQMGAEVRAAREAFRAGPGPEAPRHTAHTNHTPRAAARKPEPGEPTFEPERSSGKETAKPRSAQGMKSSFAKKRHV